jgi:uncharacterized membrane protein
MKSNPTISLLSVSILTLTLAASSYGQQSDYQIVDLGAGRDIRDMNDMGVLVGSEGSGNAYTQAAFIWNDGNLTYLTPNGDFKAGAAINNNGLVVVQTSDYLYRGFDNMGSYAYEAFPGLNGVTRAIGVDVNDRGLMVGFVGDHNVTKNDMPKPFIWVGNQVTPFLSNGFDWMDVKGVNNNDQIVGNAGIKNRMKGNYTFVSYTRYGYVYSNQVLTNLGKDVAPNDINNNGVIVGSYVGISKKIQAPARAFIYENGVKTEIPGFTALAVGVSSPSLVNSFAHSINDSKQVVGGFSYLLPTGVSVRKAFYWDSVSGVVDLNTLLPEGSGWSLDSAHLINNQGTIIGSGTYNGVLHRFMLKPVLAE